MQRTRVSWPTRSYEITLMQNAIFAFEHRIVELEIRRVLTEGLTQQGSGRDVQGRVGCVVRAPQKSGLWQGLDLVDRVVGGIAGEVAG